MTLQDVLNEFAESISHYSTASLHKFFIDLTLQRHGMNQASQACMILSEKIEVTRELLLKRRHREARRRDW